MKGLANPDSKLFSLLNKLTLLIELNICVLLSCIPVVTIGAALASMHGVLLKIYRDEEKRVIGDFFQAMKGNLKNGIILWVMYLLFLAFLAGLWFLITLWIPGGSVYLLLGLLLAAVFGSLYLNWALILQSRYVYTIQQCLKNALLAWLKYPGSTFVYLVSLLFPLVFCLVGQLLPLALMLGITLPHFISTTLYSRVFDQMEGVPARVPKL